MKFMCQVSVVAHFQLQLHPYPKILLPFLIHFKAFLWELFACPYSTNWHEKKLKMRSDESLC